MLRREALPLYGEKLASALTTPGGDVLVTLWPPQAELRAAGEEVELSWASLADVLATRRPWRGRMHHPGWSPATFAPAERLQGNVRSVAAVVFQFEARHKVSMGEFADAWSAFRCMLYTSNEHRPGASAFTAILPYSRAVSRVEHAYAVDSLAALAQRSRRPFDPASKNPARFIQLPGAIPGLPFEAIRVEGEPIIAPLDR